MRKVSPALEEELIAALRDSQAASIDDARRVLARKCIQIFGDDFPRLYEVHFNSDGFTNTFRIVEKPNFNVPWTLEFS